MNLLANGLFLIFGIVFYYLKIKIADLIWEVEEEDD